MERITSPAGRAVSYEKHGSGPPLVLVHGSFSDHKTNWKFVKPLFEKQFSIYAMARRGRGDTDATVGHSLEDESREVVAVIQSIGEPTFLLGHSYGAQAALAAAADVPDRVRKLVLYEPASPHIIGEEALARLEELAQAGSWDELAVEFFHERLSVPMEELNSLRSTELWLGFAIFASLYCSRSERKVLVTSTSLTLWLLSCLTSALRSCLGRRTRA